VGSASSETGLHELHTAVDVFIPSVDRSSKIDLLHAVNHVISKTHPAQRQGTVAGNLQAEP
jgi:hypothetical protein